MPRVLLAALGMFASAAYAADAGDSGALNTVTFAAGTGVYAAGSVTQAGEQVDNVAILDYDVGGIDQNDVSSNTSSFLVDRLLDVNVTAEGSLKQAGTGDSASTAFSVTNESNDDIDIQFVVVRQSTTGETAGPGGNTGRLGATDSSVGTVCIDTTGTAGLCDGSDVVLTPNGSGIYTIPAATAVAGTVVPIVAEVDFIANLVGGQFDNYVLAAAVTDGAGARELEDSNGQLTPDGATVTGADGDTEGSVDNVFGDADLGDEVNFDTLLDTGNDDGARNGQTSALEQVQVLAPVMTVAKASAVLYDPIVGLGFAVTSATATLDYPAIGAAGAQTPKRIPGAIVQYTIDIENDDTGGFATTAESVTLVDNLVGELAFGLGNTDLACAGAATGATGTGETCDAGVAAGDWENVLVTDCDGTTTAIASTGLAAGVSVGNCDAGDTASIVYWTSLQ